MSSPLLLTMLVLATGVLGYALMRAGFCMVDVVQQAYRRGVYGKALALWLTVMVILMGHLLLVIFTGASSWPTYALSGTSLLGGVLLGVGAGLNRGCNISTFTKLAEGRAEMLATITGWGLGGLLMAAMGAALPAPQAGGSHKALLISGAGLGGVCGYVYWMWRRVPANKRFGLLAGFRHARGMIWLIGPSAALVTVFLPDWGTIGSFFTLSVTQPAHLLSTSSMYGLGLAVLFTGMLVASWHMRRFSLRGPPLRVWGRHLFAGLLMGMGAYGIPGGSDTLLFIGLPALSPHAPGAIVMMALGIWGVERLRAQRT